MTAIRDEIEQAFLEDHRQLIGGLTRIADALAAGDLDAAVRAADDVDRKVGPHMLFEEEEYYPRLRARLGSEFVERLYHEHDEGREGVAWLLAGDATRLDGRMRAEIAAKVGTALEHALSCGSLLSHLDDFDEAEQRRLLERLKALRNRSVRWTETSCKPAAR